MSSEGEFESRYTAVLDDTLRTALSEAKRLYENMVEELQAEMLTVKKENEALWSKYNRLKKQRRIDTASQCGDVLRPPDCKEGCPEQPERSLHLVPEVQDLLQRPSEDDENRATVPLASSTSTEHKKTQAGVEDYGASQPSSDGQLLFSYCSDTDSVGSDDGEETREEQSALNSIEGQRRSLRNNTGFKPFGCRVCGKAFHNNSVLKIHMSKHAGDKSILTDDKPFRCEVCGDGFDKDRYRKMHMKIHAREKPEKPCVCTVCDKTFTQRVNLANHMRTHSKARPFMCEVCGKSFVQRGHLVMHTRIHTLERPFTCAVCDKSFNQNSGLSRHMYIHTGVRPFSCTICNKGFLTRGHLQIHIRTHTGEKPFSCTVCSKRFMSNIVLKKHVRSHAGYENPKEHMTLSRTGQEPCNNVTQDHAGYANPKEHMTLSRTGQEPCNNVTQEPCNNVTQEPCNNIYSETYDHSYAMVPL